MPGRRLMGRFAIVQEDPCPVSLTDACVDVRRFKIKLPGADDELVMAYDGNRRHGYPRGAMFKLADEIVSWCYTKLAGVLSGCYFGEAGTVHWLASVARSATFFTNFEHGR